MYYILYEGLKIDSNEPVYCTFYKTKLLPYPTSLYLAP